MRYHAAILFLAWLGLTTHAATLIYKTPAGEEKTVSGITLESISNGQVRISLDGGIETFPLSRLIKYFDDDLKSAAGAFEDNTSDYHVSLREVQIPERGRVRSKGKQETAEAEITYSISRRRQQGQSREIRVPYFYLFVLTSTENGIRKMYVYSAPSAARASSKEYDELKMRDNALSLKRPKQDVPLGSSGPGRNSFGDWEHKIKLAGIGDNRIIAWHLVVWGKDDIVATRDYRDPSYRIEEQWYLTTRN